MGLQACENVITYEKIPYGYIRDSENDLDSYRYMAEGESHYERGRYNNNLVSRVLVPLQKCVLGVRTTVKAPAFAIVIGAMRHKASCGARSRASLDRKYRARVVDTGLQTAVRVCVD